MSEAKELIQDIIRLLVDDFGYSVEGYAETGKRAAAASTELLIENIHKGQNLHDSTRDLAAKLVASGMTETASVSLLRDVMEKSAAPRDDRFRQRYDDIARMVRTASAKFGNGRTEIGDTVAPAFSDEALALQFTERFPDLRYTAAWNKWLIFDGARWRPDETREVFSRARLVCREAAGEANAKSAKNIASSKTRSAVISMASDDRRIAATVDQWDMDPWLLNTPRSVVNLRDSTMRAHRAEDYMTKMTAVAPDPSCPTPIFDKFLNTVTKSDEEYKAFLRRMCGYGLTGSTQDHAMFFLHGDGGNGKGVFMGTIMDIMGDYHRTAPIETFTDAKNERHSTELAMLRGARLLTATETETEEGKGWAESKIKTLTGGDRISARFMRQDFFEYVPQFKLMISGNHKPGLKSVDDAMRRRFNLLPFTVKIAPEDRDPHLREKLKDEWSGILAWMIKGCLEWQERGLTPPEAVTNATETYFEDQDAIAIWVDECCVRDPNAFTPLGDLFAAWEAWAEAMGEFKSNSKRFSQRLQAMGFTRANLRHRGGRGLRGIKGPLVNPNRSRGMF